MTSCREVRELLVLFAEGELGPHERLRVETHLVECAACREEASRIETVRSALSDPELFAAAGADWDALPSRLAEQARQSAPRSWGRNHWLALAASLLIVCSLLLLLRRETPRPAATAQGNDAFLRQMETVYAREATARYLAECQDLLLEIVRVEPSCEGNKRDVALEVSQARELVRRKRLLEPQLQLPAVSRARDLCDDLDSLLVDFSTAAQCESRDNLRAIERTIEREQLMLRINLLKTEM